MSSKYYFYFAIHHEKDTCISFVVLLLLVLAISVNAQQKIPPKIEWQKCLGGTLDDYCSSVQQTSDGGYILAGHSYSNNGDVSGNHSGDFWIVKLSPEGTSSVESESAFASAITISPNPATTSATLTLETGEAGVYEVQIISVTGATLKEYSTHLGAGKQEIALTDLESLPSGMYEVLVKRSGHQTLRTKFIVQ